MSSRRSVWPQFNPISAAPTAATLFAESRGPCHTPLGSEFRLGGTQVHCSLGQPRIGSVRFQTPELLTYQRNQASSCTTSVQRRTWLSNKRSLGSTVTRLRNSRVLRVQPATSPPRRVRVRDHARGKSRVRDGQRRRLQLSLPDSATSRRGQRPLWLSHRSSFLPSYPPLRLDGLRRSDLFTSAKWRPSSVQRAGVGFKRCRRCSESAHCAPQYIPPIPPPPGIAASFFCSGISQISASVVSSSDAIDDAFWRAERTTLAGSMTPAFTRSS
jgi:hypothetical protein